mmetsp:Transcript_38085/g.85058  ORF Transcript_38085/g.85058 Transcript_38085/m.85058 type:complete len:317 (-) Transcript_38085:2221-3171(-)
MHHTTRASRAAASSHKPPSPQPHATSVRQAILQARRHQLFARLALEGKLAHWAIPAVRLAPRANSVPPDRLSAQTARPVSSVRSKAKAPVPLVAPAPARLCPARRPARFAFQGRRRAPRGRQTATTACMGSMPKRLACRTASTALETHIRSVERRLARPAFVGSSTLSRRPVGLAPKVRAASWMAALRKSNSPLNRKTGEFQERRTSFTSAHIRRRASGARSSLTKATATALWGTKGRCARCAKRIITSTRPFRLASSAALGRALSRGRSSRSCASWSGISYICPLRVFPASAHGKESQRAQGEGRRGHGHVPETN